MDSKSTSDVSLAALYHQRTIYSPGSLPSVIRSSTPLPQKTYLTRQQIDLRPHLASPVEPGPAGALSLPAIARLLHRSAGLLSLGGPRPIEVYLATRGLPGIEDAIHAFLPGPEALVPLWVGDFGRDLEDFSFRQGSAPGAKAFLLLSGVFSRGTARHGERAYRRILLDAGALLARAALSAQALGLGIEPLGGFCDDAMNQLLFLDAGEEAILLVAPILDARSGMAPAAPTFPLPSPRRSPAESPPETGSLLKLLHQSSGIPPGAQEETPPSPVPSPPPSPPQSPAPAAAAIPAPPVIRDGESSEEGRFEATLRSRRTARGFTGAAVPWDGAREALEAALAPARASAVRPHLLDGSLLAIHLLSRKLVGLAAGIHRFDPETLAFQASSRGDPSQALWNLCLGQEAARDAAGAVIITADLPAAVERYGDRAYRYLHLDAGHLAERLELAARSRAIGALFVGSFFDHEVNELLTLPPEQIALAIVLLGTEGGARK